jgi:hypothetical protein
MPKSRHAHTDRFVALCRDIHEWVQTLLEVVATFEKWAHPHGMRCAFGFKWTLLDVIFCTSIK